MDVGRLAVTVIVAVVGVGIFLAVLGSVAQRVLAIRIGRFRAALACVIGLGAEISFESQVVWSHPSATLVFIPLQVGIVFLVAIAFVVVSDFVLPTGSWPRPDQWWAALRGRVSRTRRYSQITRIATRRGLLAIRLQRRASAADPGRERELARSLRLALQEAGVTFVKLGQQLCTRDDLLPPEYIAELSHLQQDAGPVPWGEIEALLTEELGARTQCFATISAEPLAAASIGQAHRGRLHDGTEVILKVQRPGIRPVVERDLDIAVRLAETLQASTDWGRALGVLDLVKGFAAALLEELDFRIEGRNMAAVAAATADHPAPEMVIPAHFPELSSERVLVAEFLPGNTLSKPASVSDRTHAQREKDATMLFGFLLREVIVDGVFHADPHPGNVMVLDDGRLGLIDFGSVGKIDSQLRAALQRLFVAVEHADPQQLFDALFELVLRPEGLDEQRLRRDLGQFMARNLGIGQTMHITMFTELVRLGYAYGLAVPSEVAGAFRAFGIMEGTLKVLAPGFDMMTQAREFAASELNARLSPAALGAAVTDEFVHVLPLLRRLPRHVDRIASAMEEGRLRANIRLLADQRDRELVTGWLHLGALTFLGGTTGLMAALLLDNTSGPAITPTMSLFQLFGYLLVVVSAILILRVLFDVFRSRRRH